MLLNATCKKYFSYIVAVSFIGGGNRSTHRKPTIDLQITKCCIEYTSAWVEFGLTTLVVVGTDCIGSCKSNYHAITTTTVPGKTYGYCNSLEYLYIIFIELLVVGGR
jgi:hypothetical protein